METVMPSASMGRREARDLSRNMGELRDRRYGRWTELARLAQYQ
jgi:hypothetical protein